eukprot:TRINITY_DN1763_c0_g1_i2.p1 TRINITY_DN1763_c0_g1~~TRINITY_DN1763_c0_g1_i2.p1  ORF type:complete len:305 (-),score=27.78 TRINITY_DN1763_c0_g1_i2:106-1020(-)
MLLFVFLSLLPIFGLSVDPKKNAERQAQYEAFKSFNPSQGEDIKYNSVSLVLQLVKKEISDADPTLLPVKELRRIFFETIVGPVQKFESEFNDILSDFVLLRSQFKDYIMHYLDFNSVCTAYIEKPEGTSKCFEYIPTLISSLERMDEVLHRIINRDEFDKRLNVIQKIISLEHMKMQQMDGDRREEHMKAWFRSLHHLDVRGVDEAKLQLHNVDNYLIAFSASFHQFRTYLKLARSHLYEAYAVTSLEGKIGAYEQSLSLDGLDKMLEYLWDLNFKSYGLMKLICQPDTSEIVVKLPGVQPEL